MLRDVGDIFGRLEPALDLERRDAGGNEFRHDRIGGEILRREQIFLAAEIDILAIADEVVGQPAGLGALPAVGAAAPERLAREALSGIGHAERAVHKHLERHRRLAADGDDFIDGEFPGEHHPLHAELLRQTDALGTGECHLRRGVQREIGTDRLDEAGGADGLDEHGVDARLSDGHDHLLELRQLVAEDERVERGVALEPPTMEHGHEPGQVVDREVRGPGPGVEAGLEAEIDGVGTVFDRGADAVPVTGGREEFGSGGHGGSIPTGRGRQGRSPGSRRGLVFPGGWNSYKP